MIVKYKLLSGRKGNNFNIMEDVIIALSTDEKYLKQTFMTIYCILLKRLEKRRKYIFHIMLSGQIEDKQLEKVLVHFRKFERNEINIINMGNLYENKALVVGRVPFSTYYRLLLPEILNVNKCLYLDQDIVVLNDISTIYNEEMNNYLIGAVREFNQDVFFENYGYLYQKYGLSKGLYVNAGVMLMNLKLMRETHWIERVKELLKIDFPVGDQDIINISCSNNIKEFPMKYNTSALSNSIEKDAIIIHYAGANKPWKVITMPCGKLWWGQCKDTPFFVEFLRGAEQQFYDYFIKCSYSSEEVIKKYASSRIVVYGAGRIGMQVIEALERNGVTPYGVAVTNLKDAGKNIGSYTVREITEFNELKEEIVVFVAIRRECDKVIDYLRNLGFVNVVDIQQFF